MENTRGKKGQDNKNSELQKSAAAIKKSVKKHETNSEIYTVLVENSTDGLSVIQDRVIKFANQRLAEMSGYSVDELTGMSVFHLVPPDFVSELTVRLSQREQQVSVPEIFYSRLLCRDGKVKETENIFRIIQLEGSPAIISMIHDVTERRKAENRLQESEDRYRLLADNVTDVIFTIGMDFNYTYASPSVYDLLGYTADEMLTMKVDKLVDTETLGWFMEMFAEEMEIEKRPDRDLKRSRVLEYQHVRKDGSKVWVENKITFLRDENNNTVGIIGTVRDITKRKETEEKLRENEANYRQLFDNSPAAIYQVSYQTGKFLKVNDAFCKYLGCSQEEICSLSPYDILTEESKQLFTERVEKIAQGIKVPDVVELEALDRNGKKGWFQLHIKNIYDAEGHVVAADVVAHDITERKKVEEALKQSEEKYRTILENMQEGYFEIDLAGNFTFVNDSTCRDFGYSREELMGMNNREYTDEANAQKLFQAFNKVYKTGEPLKAFHWEIIRKDGTKQYTEGSISLKRDSSGKPIGFTGAAHDITERRRSEDLLRQSEEKYRLLADHMKDYVWLMDLDLKVIYISPSVEKLMGYTLDDFKKFSLDKFLTADSFKSAMDFFSEEMPEALSAPPDYVLGRSLELEFCCDNGQTVWGECNFSLIRDEKGTPLSLLGVSRNINERKQMEDALRESEENFRRSLDDSPLGVRISTMEGNTLYANRAILDMYGYEKIEELKGTPLQERYTPESFAEFKERKKKRLQGEFGPSEYEISIVRKDGEIRHLHVFRKEIFWNGQKQSQVIYEDITLRRRAEDKLNETLESLRQSIKITIQVLGTASEAKDPYMAGHQRRVADLARAIATEMKLPHEKIEAIRMASAIHDIGKISVPAEILCKPAILTELEFSLVKNHSRYSYDIIKEVESPWPLADIVHQHHERVDGSGYPLGLKNGEILLESRILAVADVVEAMISYRPYRPALALDIALAEIENNAGVLYDREAVDACLRLFREKNYRIS